MISVCHRKAASSSAFSPRVLAMYMPGRPSTGVKSTWFPFLKARPKLRLNRLELPPGKQRSSPFNQYTRASLRSHRTSFSGAGVIMYKVSCLGASQLEWHGLELYTAVLKASHECPACHSKADASCLQAGRSYANWPTVHEAEESICSKDKRSAQPEV